jgi:hypothetical protein
MTKYRKYTTSDVHWKLIAQRDVLTKTLNSQVWDDGYVQAQALFCPYYDPVEGALGGDWGVIVNPESLKFGQLVFEHEWCGCPGEDGAFDPTPSHGSGNQKTNQWVKKAQH